MKVIVCGAGMVGFNIARQLASEANEVVVIDNDSAQVRRIEDQIDVRGVVGHASHPDVLAKGDAKDAELVVAVTHSDEVNMIACQVCHSIFTVPKKIARVRAQSYLKPEWQDLFSRNHLPIDEIISPELEVARSVLRRLSVPSAFETLTFLNERLMVMGVRVTDECPVVNTPLRQLTELFPDLEARVIAVYRELHMLVPSSDDQMFPGDDVYIAVLPDQAIPTLRVFGLETEAMRRVILLGGGNVGLAVAAALENNAMGIRAKLIEKDKGQAERAADQLARTVVLNGSALDGKLLEEAGAKDAEAVVALTNSDEVNVLASVLAKKLGTARALTLINEDAYRVFTGPLNIDTFINPRTTTVSRILQHVRAGRIRALRSLQDGAAEIVETEILETSVLSNKPLSQISLPAGVIVVAIERKRSEEQKKAGAHPQIVIPRGDTVIAAGDRVVMLAVAEAVKKMEELFKVTIEFF